MPTYKEKVEQERTESQQSFVFKRKDNWRRQITIFAESKTSARQALVENVKKHFNEQNTDQWFLYSTNGGIEL